MIINFHETKFDYLTPCPFNKDMSTKVGDWDCTHCTHNKGVNSSKHYVNCIHPKNLQYSKNSTKLYRRHVTVISHDKKSGHVVEESYYELTKKEAIKRFLETHKNVYRSKKYLTAVWPYEYNEESRARNIKMK